MQSANCGASIIKMKTKIYIIGFDETSNFISDIYCMKKIKDLSELNIRLDVVFAKEIEKFIGVKEYCLNHKIETIKIESGENYFISVVRYSVNNLDKKNLATLISEKNVSKLNWFFRQDPDFNSQII